jgi:hypothetical protein
MTQHLGDFPVNGMVDFKWSTNDANGASITRGTNGTLSVYLGNSATQLTTGVTDTEDFDSLTGVHHCRIDLSSSGTYAAGSECQVVLSASTIDGQTVNAVVASFSIERAGGVLALLKGTNSLAQIRTDIAGVQSDTNDIQTRLPAALVSGRIDASIGAAAANTITAAALATDAVTELVDGVWNASLTGATYNTANSAGRRLREVSGGIVTSGTAQGGATTSITLASAASSTDGTYDPAIVRIVSGTGAGQARMVIHYVGSTRVASVDRDWRVAPDNTSVYEIVASQNLISTNEGLAQGGGASTITLNANASATDNVYVGQTIVLRTGTGQDQSRIITAYNGTTKVATVASAWEVQPAAGTGYILWPLGRARVASFEPNSITAAAAASDFSAEISSAVWSETVRSLTVLDEDSTTLDLDATIRGALGMASANMDTQLGGIDTVVDALLTTTEVTSDGRIFTTVALQNAPTGGGGGVTPEDVADAVWSTALPGSYSAGEAGAIVADKTGYRLSATGVDDILDETVETGATLRQSLRLSNAALGGKASGLETTGVAFRNLADTKDVLTATVDADGNREAVSRDLT